MRRILFIGNSLTYYNDLPALFGDLANDAGFETITASVTKGGWYLSRFADPQDEMGAALRRKYPLRRWNDIVLQDQSLNPAVDPDGFLAAVRALRQAMPEGRFVFYQTFAYEAGSDRLAATGMTQQEMYDRLRDAYATAAREHGGLLVPVGEAFRRIQREHPLVNLYQPDSLHPNLAGSYLAACVFYAALSGRDPQALAAPKGIDEAKARLIRAAASQTMQKQDVGE